MRHRHYLILLILWISESLSAQRILYSPAINGRAGERFSIAGKVGEYYWIQKEQQKQRIPRQAEEWMRQEQFFEIYDARLQLQRSVPAAAITASTLKKYMVCGNRYFDEVILSAGDRRTNVQVRRYAANGWLQADTLIASFAFNEPGYSFILSVSADKNKILLLAFESVPASAPRLHSMVFDGNWHSISSLVFDQPFITQPFIQDDFFSFPSTVSSAPVQIANSGGWLMASPSRTSNNFLFLHFDGTSGNIDYKDIVLPALYKMEDIALSLNNEKGEALVGILSRYRQTAHKNVRVTHFSFSGNAFDFDSSYRFSTLAGFQSNNTNLVRESFVAVPNRGFMLLKEYGRTFTSWYNQDNYDRPWDPEFLFASTVTTHTPQGFLFTNNGYSRYSTSVAVADNYSRGDLSIFYFPGCAADSSWSGFVNKKQITELNAPSLSYLFVPLQNKLVFMYNSSDRDDCPFGSTLVLDPGGYQLAEKELITWEADQSLLFQEALQITPNEVALPYERDRQKGFAIVRF
ncbi:MAG: hypothetical protein ABIU63_15005 [Chitinophagaceae bacterium]